MEEVKEANSQIKAEIIENKEDKGEEQIENIVEEPEAKSEKNINVSEEKVENDKPQKTEENNKKRLKWWIPLIIAILVLIALSTGFALSNINNNKIIAGVTIDKVKMQGLSKEEALNLLNNKIEEKVNKELKVKVENEETEILLSQIEVEYSTKEAVEQAYNTGRNSNILVNNFNILKSKILGTNIDLEFKYNKDLLDSVVSDIKAKIPNAVKQVTYSIDNDELIITKGVKGFSIDDKKFVEEIEKNIKLDNFFDITLETFEVEPEEINIDKIYEEVHTEPKDAYYTTNPFQVYAEVVGVDFSIDEAKEILKEDKDEYIIPLTITKPKKTVNDIGTEAFPDLLSTFATRYDESNVSRSTNLKIAVSKINGVVVMPGETFSYNKTLGKRTAEAGYKGAAGYEGGKVVDMIGGGICQISSTLYDAVVYANLGIVERHNHAFTTSYVGAGKDATVVYGALDFKFKNTRKYPISIKATASNGIARVDIYGIKEEKEYEIEISTTIINSIPFKVIYEDNPNYDEGYEKVTQNGMNGCKSVTYKIYKQNGTEVSREVLSSDTYDAMNKYITRGTRSLGVVVEPVPPVNTQPVVVPEEPVIPSTPVEPEEPITPQEPENPEPGENNTEF